MKFAPSSTTSRTFSILLALSAFPAAHAASDTWDNGAADGAWATLTNWVTEATVPGTGDTATFDAASANTTIDLGGATTINHLVFNNAGTSAFTIGVAGVDTLTFDNGGGIDTNAALDADQTIAADLLIGNSAGNTFRIDTESTTNRIIITGDIDTGTGGTPGTQRFEVGDLGGASAGKTVQIDGSISNSGGATRIELYVGGADLEMNGLVDITAGGSTMRTIIKDTATATVSSTGAFGRGTLEVRRGTLNLNTDLQQLDNTLILGDTGGQTGPAVVNIGAANTLALNTGITYEDRTGNADASVASVLGGTLQITGANRAIIVHNNPDVVSTSPELTISSTITAGGATGVNGDNDLSFRGANLETEGGTFLLAPTGTANSFGGVTVQTGTLQLGAGGLSSEGDFLTLSAWNNANAAADTVATVDLLGTTHALGNGTGTAGVGGNITVGGTNTATITDNGFSGSLVDTVGGGALTNVNAIVYNDGTGTGIQRNGAAVISIDNITFDITGDTKTTTIQDGEAVTDLTLSSALNTDAGAAGDNDNFSFIGEGTLAFNGSLGQGGVVGAHNITDFTNQKTVLGTGTGSNVGGENLFRVTQRNNNGTFSDFDVELDINGETVVLQGGLTIGNTNNTGNTPSNVSITDSVGTGEIQLTGSFGGNRTIKYEHGGGTNLTHTIAADLRVMGNNSTINVENGADAVDLIISGDLLDGNTGGRNYTKSGTGTLQITSTDNLYNVLSINQGTVQIAGDGSLGDNDVQIGTNNNAGVFEYQGAGETINNKIRIGDNSTNAARAGAGTITNTGSGTVTFSNAAFNTTRPLSITNRTLTLDGTSDGVISGVIADNQAAATISLIKNGTNTWTLNGANTYTGDTNINAGCLYINGSVAGNVIVADGACLGGTGTVTGTTTFGTTAGVDLHIDGTSPGLTSTGAVDTSNGVTVFVDASAGGVITVLNYGVGSTVDISHFTLDGSVATGARGVGPFVNTGTSITIDLGFVDNTWAGTDGTNPTFWDIGTTANWTNTTDSVFQDGDDVTMDDSASNFGPSLQSNITVGDMLVGAIVEANDYTFSDSGGGETLTVNGTLTVLNQGTATANGVDVRFNNVIAGDGSVFIGNGDGNVDASQNSVRFDGVNTFTGGLTVDEGRFLAGNDSAAGTGVITLSDTGNLNNRDPIFDLLDGITIANDFVISNTGSIKVIRVDNFGAGVRTGTVTGNISTNEPNTGNTQLTAGANDTLTLSGVVSGVAGLRKTGTGTLVLDNAANSFARAVRVDRGTVQVASIGDIGVNSHAGSNTSGEGFQIGNNANAGTLEYTGAVASSNRQVEIGDGNVNANRTGGGIFLNTGSGTFTFSNAAFNVARTGLDDTSDRPLIFDGTGDLVVSGVIIDNTAVSGTAAIAVTKNGVNTLTLSAANTYTGDTTVNAGTLSLGDGASNTTLADAADVVVATGAVVNLNYVGTDTIDELSLGGVLKSPGVWGSTASGAANVDDTFFTGSGTLTVTTGPAATAYDIWAAGHGLVGPAALVTADDEPDTLVNLLEFGFGTDPNAMDNAQLAADGSVNGTPLPVFTGGGGGVTFDLYYVRRDDVGTSGSVEYTVQFSGDLVTFHDSTAIPVFVADSSDDAAYEVVKVPYPLVLPDFKKARFVRVKVTQVP